MLRYSDSLHIIDIFFSQFSSRNLNLYVSINTAFLGLYKLGMAFHEVKLSVKQIVFPWIYVVVTVIQALLCFLLVVLMGDVGPFGLSSQGDGAMPRTT